MDEIGEDTSGSRQSLPLLQKTTEINNAMNFLFPPHILVDARACLDCAFLSPRNIFVDEFNDLILDFLRVQRMQTHAPCVNSAFPSHLCRNYTDFGTLCIAITLHSNLQLHSGCALHPVDTYDAVETWTIPQIKLKNALDGLTLPQKSPLSLLPPSTTPVPESAAAIPQPDALINEFIGESPEALVETVIPPLAVTTTPNGQPTPLVSSIPVSSAVGPTEVLKKASKARPSSKKNGR
ncbi:hypothetical protein BDR07DRAFT_1480780 [Suillus spraguei]|nr:hypothetical protein BDR07DRAFT_1480780 [Suillus spraguei]